MNKGWNRIRMNNEDGKRRGGEGRKGEDVQINYMGTDESRGECAE